MTGLVNGFTNFVSKSSDVVSKGVDYGRTVFNPNAGTGSGADTGGGKTDILERLSTGLNLGSAAMRLFASEEAAQANITQARQIARGLELDAQQSVLEARQEELRGKQESNDILDNLRRTIAAQQLAGATNGIDISFGSVPALADNARERADRQLSISREDALIRSLSRRRQAVEQRISAANTITAAKQKNRSTRISGVASAIGTVAQKLEREKRRG
jgi:hypothetical protein